MLVFTLQRLHEAIADVCPIRGVGGEEGKVSIDYAPSATQAERDNAQAVASNFDWSDATTRVWLEGKNPEKRDLKAAAANAIQANQAFLELESPTNAEALQQIRRLTNQVNRIIQRLVQIP